MKRTIFAIALIVASLFGLISPWQLNLPTKFHYFLCALGLACGIVIWSSVVIDKKMDYLRTRLRDAERKAIEVDQKSKGLEAKCRNYERIIGNATTQQVKLNNKIIAYRLNYARLKKRYDEKKG
jgi:ABC-type antimicrobial peptide transport system permease subunit